MIKRKKITKKNVGEVFAILKAEGITEITITPKEYSNIISYNLKYMPFTDFSWFEVLGIKINKISYD
jgi:hypothetical protein